MGSEGRRVTGEQVLFHESRKVGGTDASINQGLTLLFRNMLGSSSSEMLPALDETQRTMNFLASLLEQEQNFLGRSDAIEHE